jgi:hypothetical protein
MPVDVKEPECKARLEQAVYEIINSHDDGIFKSDVEKEARKAGIPYCTLMITIKCLIDKKRITRSMVMTDHGFSIFYCSAAKKCSV